MYINTLARGLRKQTGDMMNQNYNTTIRACCMGYIVQAIVNNFIPLLFVFFNQDFGIPLSKITFLVTINFTIQLVIDLVSAGFIDKIGYRASVILADAMAAAGILALGILPYIMDPYTGMLISILLYAIGGGLLEVVVSPLVDACPSDHKAGIMSLLHSFYCWGHVAVVLLSTLFFVLFGMENWRIAAFLWAILPIVNLIHFLRVPIPKMMTEETHSGFGGLLTQGMFWLMFVLMVCSGAAEQAMSQWVSAFAEKGLNISKSTGDVLGTCMFAAMMGSSRLLYAQISKKVSLKNSMLFSSVLCVISYLIAGCIKNPAIALIGCGLCGFSVGILWPGTYSIASKRIPTGGTTMFALLALGGDIGCSGGPTLVGLISGAADDNLKLGLLAAIIFPVLLILGLLVLKRKKA